ncbi:MAG TPA: sigma-70 family RNA polymerase sigma factor [Sedimentisphaerales bacterium]|nr:sigma-70 family RNA polymerase sigma factor [Sedimentisphaerales bacterium]
MNDRESNEVMLVCAARRGDKDALQTLLSRNWSWVRGLVYGVLRDASDLDDVMQEICVRVITRIQTLREPERFRAWLAILARREAIKAARRRKPEPVGQDEPQYAIDPAEDVAKKELFGRVLEAVRELPAKYREVFMLAHSGGLTYAQMAEALDVPITTMQIRLVRARQMIRDRIAPQLDCVSRGDRGIPQAEGA